MLYSNLGRSKTIDGELWLETTKGQAGHVIYGPYVRLKPGRYAVTLHVRVTSPRLKNVVCCTVEVAGAGNRVLVERNVTTGQLIHAKGLVDLSFTADREDVFEFRVHAAGSAALCVKAHTDLRLLVDETSDFSPVLEKGERTDNQFFMTRFARFEELHRVGFRFDVASDAVVARYAGLAFHVDCEEDLLLINEIFLFNDYNVISRRDRLVVDIGMNAGLTSLYMANMAGVREVHAFEPFATPFDRALRNFALNPLLSGKITASRYGLGGADETLGVRVSPSETIGLSVRGVEQGAFETIEVRDAGEPIRALARRARDLGLELVVKMDCEGSEFPIFEALERDGLLSEIDALVIEWHRWWAKDKTQQDLIRPLLAADFIVMDRTNPTGLYSGLLYAVRRTGP